jgi:thiamine biosynthesis lipoprotein
MSNEKMKQTKIIMGMPITVEVVGLKSAQPLKKTFDYFTDIDNRFSPYKEDSELSRLNRGEKVESLSSEMQAVLKLCEHTKQQSGGYFDINNGQSIDTSGLVKGWAIKNAAQLLRDDGYSDFYIEAGGDIQAEGLNEQGEPWQVGIRNPFNIKQIVKVVTLSNAAIATSGTYIRGHHIYNPKNDHLPVKDSVSLSVIGPNIYDADRFATAAFAMGPSGLSFIAALPGFEGYMVNDQSRATYTEGFIRYVR